MIGHVTCLADDAIFIVPLNHTVNINPGDSCGFPFSRMMSKDLNKS